jgi:hypothetical protein
MPYTAETILTLLRKGEGAGAEFKESIRDAATLARIISAFGNADGGVLLVGVGPNGHVVGADATHVGRLFHAALATIVNAPRVDLEATAVNGKQVLTVTVGKGERLVSTDQGIFTRVDHSEAIMSAADVAATMSRSTSVVDENLEPSTGWARVDRQLAKAQRALTNASTEEDYQTVGLLSRETLISLAQAVYDASRHPTIDAVQPSLTDASRMLDAFISAELAGAANEELRRHAKSALTLANSLQHRRTAGYLHAALTLEALKATVSVVALVSGRQRNSMAFTDPSEPFRISRLNEPELQRITDLYRNEGREPVLPKMEDRDVKLVEGYEIAYYPGTRREVWVGYHQGAYEHLLMLKPRQR